MTDKEEAKALVDAQPDNATWAEIVRGLACGYGARRETADGREDGVFRISQRQAVGLGDACLLLFGLSLFLSIPAGGYGSDWYWGLLELIMGWKIFAHKFQGYGWAVARGVYLLAIWCGIRSVVQARPPRPRRVKVAGVLSLAAIALGALAYLVLPG